MKTTIKKCQCGNDVCETGAPHTILQFTIPFTKIEILIWNWNAKDYSDYCMDCLLDMEQSKIIDHTDEAFDSGFESGYEKAMKEQL